MPDKKISQLTSLPAASASDIFVVVDTAGVDETKQIVLADLMGTPGPIGGTSPSTGEFTQITLVNAVNEYSTDGLLSGDSDSAIPTERAVKAYSDIIPNITSEPTGFPNRTDSAITMGVGAANRFSIAPTGVSFDYYIVGFERTKAAPETIDLSDDQGLHYIYYDGATLTESLVFDVNLLKDKAYIAVVYWDTTADVHIYMGDERHGLVMDWATHAYLHNTRGTVWNSGLSLADIVSDGTGSLDIDVQFGYSQGVIYDEDIKFTIAEASSPASIPIFYQINNTGDWRRKTANTYPLLESGSTADYSGTRLGYNEFSGGVWSLTEVPNDNYILIHFFATNDPDQEVIGIVGQNYYATLDDAQTGAQTELQTLILTDLPFVEFTAIATVINQTSDSYTNTPKARIVQTEEGADYVDWRGVQGQSRGSVAISDHGNLTGLADDDHIQYSLASGTRAFVGTVSGITPTIDSHLTTKGYVDLQISGNVPHNQTTGLQGGDSTADEFYHLTQAIHDGLYSGSPIIGLGDSAGTKVEVDYGLDVIAIEASGSSIGMTSTEIAIAASGHSIGMTSTGIAIAAVGVAPDITINSGDIMSLIATDDIIINTGSALTITSVDDSNWNTGRVNWQATNRISLEVAGGIGDYLTLQAINQDGWVKINADDTGYVSIQNKGIEELRVDTNGMSLKSGVLVNEISNDGTLTSDSTAALVTESAIKEYVDNVVATDVIADSELLTQGLSSVSITFDVEQPDGEFSVVGNIMNNVDAVPSLYVHLIRNQSVTGFDVLFSGVIDSTNYEFSWILARYNPIPVTGDARITDDDELRLTDDDEVRLTD